MNHRRDAGATAVVGFWCLGPFDHQALRRGVADCSQEDVEGDALCEATVVPGGRLEGSRGVAVASLGNVFTVRGRYSPLAVVPIVFVARSKSAMLATVGASIPGQ